MKKQYITPAINIHQLFFESQILQNSPSVTTSGSWGEDGEKPDDGEGTIPVYETDDETDDDFFGI